ncbi:MAG: SpoIIE family protein phosphatase [Deltaproteobacteria bacterium]|jgi:sigma-B regulation protein RsbU (phosphoserine phosphatase)|nr:SpoIIE family protein phosphatase [Deltaproteobacteria bacterium]
MSISKILVVEDHPASLKMLAKMLGKNYSVFSASSGQEATSIARKEKPDLVLLDIEMPGMDGFQTFDILKTEIIDQAVPVIFLTAREDSQSREKGLAAGAVDYITKPYDSQELAIKVKNHLALYEARKEIEARNRIMAKEMEMASQLQNSLLPHDFPTDERVNFFAVYRPVSKAGGDFYDVIELPDSKIGFAQVDVSGHGVSAAMIGAMFKMAFQSFARVTPSPAKLLALLNNALFQLLPDSDFLTVFYGIIDTNSLELIFTNAGHPRPFLYRNLECCVEELAVGGPLIGAFPNMAYDEENIQLAPGDGILVFTDGVTEAEKISSSDIFYGENRLSRVFLESCCLESSEILRVIMNDLEEFRGDTMFDDDVSMMLASVK